MAKIRNKVFRSDDSEYLELLAAETEFIGREFRLDLKAGTLTVFALPQRHKKSPKAKREVRNKRAESAARHNS